MATTMLSNEQKVQEIQHFLCELYGGFELLEKEFFFYIFTLPNRKSKWFPTTETGFAQAAKYVSQIKDQNVYVPVGVSKTPGTEHSRIEIDDVAAIVGFGMDMDYAHPVHKNTARKAYPPTVEATQKIACSVGLDPSMIIHSGYGLQSWWLFKEPWIFDTEEEKEEAKTLSWLWQETLKAKAKEMGGWTFDSTADLSRVLRIPYTNNVKESSPVEVTYIQPPVEQNRYNPSQFEEYTISDTVQLSSTSNWEGIEVELSPDANPSEQKLAELMRNEKFSNTWNLQRRNEFGLDLSRYDFSLANFAVNAGWNDQEIANLIIAFRRENGDKKDFYKALRPDYIPRTISKVRFSKGKSIIEIASGLVQRANDLGSAAPVYEAAANLTHLSQAEFAQVKTYVKENLSKEIKINLNDFEKARNEAKKQIQKRDKDGRPYILYTNRPLRDIVEDAINALVERNTPPQIFVRSGELARVRKNEKGEMLIEPFNVDRLRVHLSQVCNFIRILERLGPQHMSPPEDVIRSILSLGKWPFPAIEGIVEAPTVREDGTILDQPGYDPLTKLVYSPLPGFRVAQISPNPTVEEVESAKVYINEILWDFPFVSDADRANAIGLLLTPLIRPLIKGPVPLALVDAPQAGTGKGLLVDLVWLIATGRLASITTAPEREDEWRKSITAALEDGSPIITIDNIEHTLRSESLAAVLTSDRWKQRRIGSPEMVNLPNRATWVATGNNIKVAGDIARRSYHIRLDAKISRPWQRTEFRHPDLKAWVSENRDALIWALLTIVRSWFATGQPIADVPKLGRFESWSQTIGSILEHSKIYGFLSNLEQMYDQMDEEAAEWETFLTEWISRFGENPISTKDFVDFVKKDPEFAEMLPESVTEILDGPASSITRKLGKLFAKKENRRFGEENIYLQKAGLSKRAVLWQVKSESPDPSI